jgi:hypothetical protein
MPYFIACILFLASLSHANEFYKIGLQQQTDKVYNHRYHFAYDPHLSYVKHHTPANSKIKLLEIGLGCTMNTGYASIETWKAYFGSRLDLYIADIDVNCSKKVQSHLPNKIMIGDQGSEADLLRFVKESGGEFDIIVDDGSHFSDHQLESFRVLWEHGLKPGGIYFIEDIEGHNRTLSTGSHPFDIKGSTRDWIIDMTNELLTFRLNWASKDPSYNLPEGLQYITVQREMAVFKKCLKSEPRCWGPDAEL